MGAAGLDQPLCRLRFRDLHRGLGVVHVQHIRLMVVRAVGDRAQVVRSGVCRVGIVADLREQRPSLRVPGDVIVGFEAAVQPSLEVDRLLLVVGGGDLRGHGAYLLVIVRVGEDRAAQHRAVVLHGFHRDVLCIRPVAQRTAGKVARRPAGHDDNDLVAGLGTRKHGIREPLPLFFEDILVESLLSLLDQVVDDQDARAEAGRRAAGGSRQIAGVLPFERPLARGRLAVLDAGIREDVREHRAVRVELLFCNTVPHRAGKGCGQRFVVTAGHNLFARIAAEQPLGQQNRRAALAMTRRHVDHHDLTVTLAERLQAAAQLL